MTSVLGTKRSISQLLNQKAEEDNGTSHLEPPRRRQRVDNDAGEPSALTTTPDPETTNNSGSSAKKECTSSTASAFLALSDARPASVPFQQPSQLTSFSYTPAHVQEFTDSALRYFVEPPRGAKLSYGYDRWTRRQDERGRLDSLLRAISRVKKDAKSKEIIFPEIGIISWRGVMTKILTAVYETREEWELNVMSVKGTLYFEEHLTEERLREKNNMESRQRMQTYYGYAFESYCTSEVPESKPRRAGQPFNAPPGWGGDVDTNVQWCSVVRTKLGDTRIILGGEVDCIRGKYTGKTNGFVELKTSLTIRGKQDEARFEKKLLKFYFQSFLLGVPEIVVGFRTPSGVLSTVERFQTIQIPRMVRNKPGGWDPLVCLDFGQRVVTFLNTMIQKATQSSKAPSETVPVWRVKFVPGSGLSVTELEPAEVAEVVNGEDRVGFLPRWYWDEIQAEGHREERKAAVPTSSLGWRT